MKERVGRGSLLTFEIWQAFLFGIRERTADSIESAQEVVVDLSAGIDNLR